MTLTPATVRTIAAPNPLSAAVDWPLVESTLGVKIVPDLPQRKKDGAAGAADAPAAPVRGQA